MKIAILSDTHNNHGNAQISRKLITEAAVEAVIHCGDFIDSSMVDHWGEFKLYCVYGNGDFPAEIKERVTWFREDNRCGESLELNLDGKQIFVTHGHRAVGLAKAIESQQCDYVFHGHTHRFKDEKAGRTRVINPGALGGKKVESRSFVILDLEKDEIERVELD